MENNSIREQIDQSQSEDITNEEEESEDENVSEMKAMRKEMDLKMLNMEAEFAQGASRMSALRLKMKKLREASKANNESD